MTTKEEIYVAYKMQKDSFNFMHSILKKEGIINDDARATGTTKDLRPIKIVQLVEELFNSKVLDKNRKQHTIYTRQACSYLLRRYTRLSLSEIALHVGVKDHTTVHYHIKKCQDIIDTEYWFKDKIDIMIAELDEYILYLSNN